MSDDWLDLTLPGDSGTITRGQHARRDADALEAAEARAALGLAVEGVRYKACDRCARLHRPCAHPPTATDDPRWRRKP